MKASLLVILVMIYLQNFESVQGLSCSLGYSLSDTMCIGNNAIEHQPCYSCATKCPTGSVLSQPRLLPNKMS